MQKRHERLEQDLKLALSNIITYEVKNPSVTGLISVTEVKITSDQKYAKVYISVYGKKGKEKVIQALNNSEGFIKSELGKAVRMRNIPALKFELDDSIEYGSYMDKVIDEVIKKDNENNL